MLVFYSYDNIWPMLHGPEAYNIYMVELGRYKWYQSQSLTQMWESIMFGPIGGVCPFGHEKVVYMGVFVIFYIR